MLPLRFFLLFIKRSDRPLSRMVTYIDASVSIIGLLITVIFFPKFRMKKAEFQTFYLIPLLGVLLILLTGNVTWKEFYQGLTADTAMNPLKILVLFFSMTFLSVVLDEVGLFRVLADFALKHVRKTQLSLFIALYLLTSFLTLFTSNDVITLTFTPFITFFCHNARISPLPFLVESFIAANTFSMLFIIGNPTNIYLAGGQNISFIAYTKVMAIPTIFASPTAFFFLYLMFRKQLKEPMEVIEEEYRITDRLLMIVGVIGLAVCTLLLAISSYLGFEMYLICLVSAAIVLFICTIYSFIKKIKDKDEQGFVLLANTAKRLPYTLVPFLLSMFCLVMALNKVGFTKSISGLFEQGETIFTYGLASLLSCNLINNIPMSVLYENIIAYASTSTQIKALYSAVIGSNLGVFLTPIGALAGIMWMSILKQYGIRFAFLDFMKYGIPIGTLSAIAALGGLELVFLF